VNTRTLVFASLRHYRALHLLVAAGVAVAVAVLAGALLVGGSVRASLRELALARLGHTEAVATSTGFFREALAQDVASSQLTAVPMLALAGAVTHEESRRTAAHIQIFGIDDRFLAFHGIDGRAPSARQTWMSRALARELGAAEGDTVLLRLAKPTDIPLSHLQGRRDDVSERIRLTVSAPGNGAAILDFSLLPSQGPTLALFVPLRRIQQDLDLDGRTNVVLAKSTDQPSSPPTIERDLTRAIQAAARPEDRGLRVRTDQTHGVWILESETGLLPDATAKAVAESTPAGTGVGALTYLANSIRIADRVIPYSLITAIDLDAYDAVVQPSTAVRRSSAIAGAPAVAASPAAPPIRLNAWAAADLRASPGDTVDVEYFLWSDADGLQTRSATFTFVGIVPMEGAGGDRSLTPEYPGITDAADVTSWDPPFPVDLDRVRPQDEDYWDRWRGAPKAFISLERGQSLWPSAFGTLSSWRARQVSGTDPSTSLARVGSFPTELLVRNVRAEALAAADGTTDFGEYFVYFSFFIVVSGLLLAGLFFALTVEQRARELGLLFAVGFGARDVRRTMMTEAAIVSLIGSVVGLGGAVAYAGVIMYGLRTWWVGAVGTTALRLHVDPVLLAGGAVGALLASLAALLLSMRRATRRTARTLLTSGLSASADEARSGGRDWATWALYGSAGAAIALVAAGLAGALNQVAAFFGAGSLLMIAGCAAFAVWLGRAGSPAPRRSTLARFGMTYARWRPTRSVLCAALIAFACFVIVSVGAFRKDPAGLSLEQESGTGGFALMAESAAPLMHNPNTDAGRDELSLAGYPELEGTHIARFRLRPGDEASCLTLYQPKNPRILAPEPSFLKERRFSFAQSLAETPEERENPWRLLDRRFADGAVPAIADATTLAYVFHLRVGDDFLLPREGGDPVKLRIVATLADSLLQSELIVGEHDFVRLFPRQEGYRVWLVAAPQAQTASITTLLEDRLSDFGIDVVDTRARLAAYHQVENTYLSTFQALGALGLLLGTLGLAAVLARNVLERRREIGLLAAIGFTPAHLRTTIAAESLVLVTTGVAIGTVAAIIAVAPAVVARAETIPAGRLALLLAAVVATGLLSSVAAVKMATATKVVEAIKNE
jgi:putative ABC transport system permease protein